MNLKSFFIFVLSILFVSCSNFLNGSELKKQLEDEINFKNGYNAAVKFTVPAGTGAIEPVGEHIYRIDSYEDISFSPVEKYSFYKWEAYNENGELLDDSIIHFENPFMLNTKVTFCGECKNVVIQPVTYLTKAPLEYNPEDFTFEVSFTTDSGYKIEMKNYNMRIDGFFKVYRDKEAYINSISKNITFSAVINTKNTYKRLYLAYESGAEIAEKYLSKGKNDIYCESITLPTKSLSSEGIYFWLEDFYGKKIKLHHDNDQDRDLGHKEGEEEPDYELIPDDIFKKSTILNSNKVILKQLEPYKFQLSSYDSYKSKFLFKSDLFLIINNVTGPDYIHVFSVMPGFNPETDYAFGNSDNYVFLENLTFEVYGGTTPDNLTLLKDCVPQWNSSERIETISLPKNRIDTTKDYYFKTVVKAINGEEVSDLWSVKTDVSLSKLFYDGSKYYMNVTIPEELRGEKWDLYCNGVVDKTYEFFKKDNLLILDSASEGDELYLKLKAENCFCNSNKHSVTLNEVTERLNGSFISDFVVKSGEKSSAKYTATLKLNSTVEFLREYVKYVVKKGDKFIAEVTKEAPVFEIHCDDLINVSEEPLKIFAVAKNGKTDSYTIDYSDITFINNGVNEGKKIEKKDFRKSVLDLTPPDVINATFTSSASYLNIILPDDIITYERDGNNSYLCGYVYWVPFKSEWEGLPVNEIPVSEELFKNAYQNGNCYDVERVIKYWGTKEAFNRISVSRKELEKNDKTLIVLKVNDNHENECHVPVFVYETDHSLVEGIKPNCYGGYISVNRWLEFVKDKDKYDFYHISVPQLYIDAKIELTLEIDYVLSYHSLEKLDLNDYAGTQIYFARIQGNHGLFATSPLMYVWNSNTEDIKYDYMKFQNGSLMFYLNGDLGAYVKVIRSSEDYGDSLADWERNTSNDDITETKEVKNGDFFRVDFNRFNYDAQKPYFENSDYYIIAVYWPDTTSEILVKGRYFL